jgi:hypothetical protein
MNCWISVSLHSPALRAGEPTAACCAAGGLSGRFLVAELQRLGNEVEILVWGLRLQR